MCKSTYDWMCLVLTRLGVAVWRQYGSPAMCQGGPHRAHQEALQQWHRLLRQAKRAEGRWGVDGWIQIPRLHGLEHPHERKLSLPWISPWASSLLFSLAHSDMQPGCWETLVNRNSKFRFHPFWPSHWQVVSRSRQRRRAPDEGKLPHF